MKKALLLITFLTALAAFSFGQPGPASAPRYYGKKAADPATCSEGSWYYNTVSHAFKYCSAANTWSALGGSSFTGVTNPASGELMFTPTNAFDAAIIIQQAADSGFRLMLRANGAIFFNNGAGSQQFNIDRTANAGMQVTPFASTSEGLSIKLAASPSANGFEINSSGGSGGDLYRVNPDGFTTSSGDKRVASNATNATATISSGALSDLTLTLAASGKYAGTLSFLAKNSTAAEGLQFDFNGGTATITSVQFGFPSTPPGVTLGVTNSTALATALTATTATTTDVWYTINFIVVVNAAGTIIPRFAEVSHTSGTATVEAGSFSNIRRY